MFSYLLYVRFKKNINRSNILFNLLYNFKLFIISLLINPELLFLGILLIYFTGLYLHWRIVAWIAFAGAILPVFMTAFWTPESPLWLIHKGQDSKALKSLEYLKNSKYVSFF